MVALQKNHIVDVPLEEIVGKIKNVPKSHQWVKSARKLGTCFGDE
jgi:6-phosphofructokinase 1